MSELTRKLDRLWRATHTFVTSQDCRLIAGYWKARLDDAGVEAGDFKAECAELGKMLATKDSADGDTHKTVLQDFVDNNTLAYYAFMDEGSLRQIQLYPQGRWIGNEFDGFLRVLNEVWRKLHKDSNR